MKKYSLLLLISFVAIVARAQDDLLDELNKIQKPVANYASATFKSSRIVSGHSIETIAAKHLDFRISHRFGALNSGYQELFGLDQSQIRLGFEFGLTDRLTVGVGRNSYQKTYDYYAKYKLLRKSSGA